MGFRITDRFDKKAAQMCAQLKRIAIEEEAERLLKREGSQNQELKYKFIDKILAIQNQQGAEFAATHLVEHLEETLRQNPHLSKKALGQLDLTKVLDLLSTTEGSQYG